MSSTRVPVTSLAVASLGCTLMSFAHAQAQGASVAAISAAEALTQATPAGGSPQEASAPLITLQEVMVTAERRVEDVERTPVAVTSVSGTALEDAGATNLTSLAKVAPDVIITNQNSGATVSIRGVYSFDNSPTSESAVATYFDGGFLSKGMGLEGFLFDVQRVEVDKGPQGTLFGADTNGGAINIISNRPVLSPDMIPSGEGQLEYGSYDLLRTEGVINLPISGSFALRGAFQTYSHSGYLQSGLDDADTQSGRLSALWRPSGRDSLYVVTDYSRDMSYNDDGPRNVIGQLAALPGQTLAPVYVATNPRNDTFYDGSSKTGFFPWHRDSVMEGVTAQNNYDASFASWTTELTYRHFDINPSLNPNGGTQGCPQTSFTSPCLPATTPLGVGGVYAGGGYSSVPQFYTSYSLESRLISLTSTPLRWVAGIYLYQDHDGGLNVTYANPFTTTPQLSIGNPYELARSAAAFGQLTYTPSWLRSLHLTAGGRADTEHKTVKGIFTQFGTRPYASYLPETSHTWSAGTYRFGISDDLTDKSLLYADTATGFEAGGYGFGPGVNPAVGPLYEPEKITAYEVGNKNRLLDGTLQLNLEAWWYKYRNYLNIVSYQGPHSPLPIITDESTGDATYKGATAELQDLLTPQDQLRLTASYEYGRYGHYVQYAPAGYFFPGGATTVDLSGTPIAEVPTWSGNFSYMHTWSGVWHGQLTGEVDMQFSGTDLMSLTPDGGYGFVRLYNPGWETWDLSLQYQPDSANWSMRVYVHNLTNKLVYTAESVNTTTQALVASFYPPRIVGVMLSAKF